MHTNLPKILETHPSQASVKKKYALLYLPCFASSRPNVFSFYSPLYFQLFAGCSLGFISIGMVSVKTAMVSKTIFKKYNG